MARRVFFSFHYQRDIFRVNVVRNSGIVEGSAAAGFHDASLWEEAKRNGDAAVKRLIDRGLEGTTVTAVLIGAETASRKYVDYEIERSIKIGNGILGIYIHQIPIPYLDYQGMVPWRLTAVGAPLYYWDRQKFGEWVEDAYQKAQVQKIVRPSIASALGLMGSYRAPETMPPPMLPRPAEQPFDAQAFGEFIKRYLK